MNNQVSNYIRKASNGAFNNASGSFRNATGVDTRMPSAPSGWNAAGSQQGAIPTSQPFILTISNASTGAVANFDVFGANQYLYGGYGTFTAGTWAYQNVTVSSGISNTTYQQLLSQSKDKPFSVGQTMLIVQSGSNSQLTQPITFNVTNQDGTSLQVPLIPTYNIFQNITTQTVFYTKYTIDGNAKLTFNNVAAQTVFQVFLYPEQSIDLTSSLVGGSVSNKYGNPKTNQQSVVIR